MSKIKFTDIQIEAILSIIKQLERFGALRLQELSSIFLGNYHQTRTYVDIATDLGFLKKERIKNQPTQIYMVSEKGCAFYEILTGKKLEPNPMPGHLIHSLTVIDYILSCELGFHIQGKKPNQYKTLTDTEIARHKDTYRVFNKYADALIFYSMAGKTVFDWVEVEHTRKNKKNMENFISFLDFALANHKSGLMINVFKLNQIVVLCNTESDVGGPDKFLLRLKSAIKTYSNTLKLESGKDVFEQHEVMNVETMTTLKGIDAFLYLIEKSKILSFVDYQEVKSSSNIAYICNDLEKKRGEIPDSPHWFKQDSLFSQDLWHKNQDAKERNRKLLADIFN